MFPLGHFPSTDPTLLLGCKSPPVLVLSIEATCLPRAKLHAVVPGRKSAFLSLTSAMNNFSLTPVCTQGTSNCITIRRYKYLSCAKGWLMSLDSFGQTCAGAPSCHNLYPVLIFGLSTRLRGRSEFVTSLHSQSCSSQALCLSKWQQVPGGSVCQTPQSCLLGSILEQILLDLSLTSIATVSPLV